MIFFPSFAYLLYRVLRDCFFPHHLLIANIFSFFLCFIVPALLFSVRASCVWMICRRWLGARVVKVSHQQSKRVKCLSCLFTVNDGFDSSPKEQWETRSEGSALGWIGGGERRGFIMLRALLFIEWGIFHASMYMCVHVLLEAAESLWSVRSEQYFWDVIFHPPSHLSTHPPSTAAQWACWWLLRYRSTVALRPIYHDSATLTIQTHTPDWGQFSLSFSYPSFTFECIGLRTDFCLTEGKIERESTDVPWCITLHWRAEGLF